MATPLNINLLTQDFCAMPYLTGAVGCDAVLERREHARQMIRGLYGITPDIAEAAQIPLLCHHVEAALQAGLRLLQLRNKSLPKPALHALGVQLKQLCAAYQTTLIVNDDLELACEIDAHGVHLGQTDPTFASARQQLRSNQMIGISCYNQLQLAEQAAQHGADYIAFGSVFASTTKPHAVQASLDLFHHANALNLPCVAIGGITRQNAVSVLQAGASAIAVISDLFGDLNHPDNAPQQTAQRMQGWQTVFHSLYWQP